MATLHGRSVARAATLTTVLMALTSGCGGGGDDVPTSRPTSTTVSPAVETTSTEAPGSGALTTETVADRCDELVPIVATLRGSDPERIEPSAAIDATIDGLAMRTAHCTFAYAGDSFRDPDRVDVYLDTAPGDLAGITAHWEAISVTEPIDGIGEAASWYYTDSFDAKSSARTLIGDTVYSVRVSVPRDQAGADYLSKDAVAAALRAVVALT